MKPSELIQRAKQIADLENTSYFSDSELNNLINEVYYNAYTDLISIGDKYFIKTYKFTPSGSSDTATLPNDFMTLNAVYYLNNNYKVQLERQPNMSNNNLSYDLINNSIKIYGNNQYEIIIEYYPTPDTIVYPAAQTEAEIDVPNNIFVNYLAYLMAIYFKQKQGADVSLLQASLDNVWSSYCRILNRDGFKSVRINNVYKNKGWL